MQPGIWNDCYSLSMNLVSSVLHLPVSTPPLGVIPSLFPAHKQRQ